jgi:tetratricopeptide (TPR) repeat protein
MLLADWKRHKAKSLVAAEASGDATAISWTPPEDLRTAFARQYGGLSTDAQHVLQVLAVAGKSLATSELANLLGLEGRVVERAVLEMLDRAIGRVEEGRLSFKNELHRAFVYYATGEEKRNFHHSRLAVSMLASKSQGFQGQLEASHHFLRAGMRAEAVESAVSGAELAIRRGAPGEALRALSSLMRQYPEETSSPVCLVLAEAMVAAGRFRDALKTLGMWSPSGPDVEDHALAAQLRAEALHRGRLADDDAIHAAAHRAVELAERAANELMLVRALQVQAEVAAEMGDFGALKRSGLRAARAEASQLPECRTLGAMTRGYSLLISGSLDGAIKVFASTAPELQQLSLLVELRRVLNGMGICYTGLARLAEAERCFKEAIRLAEQVGDDVASCNAVNNLGVAYHEAGMFLNAAAEYRKAMGLLASHPTTRVAAPLYANAGRLSVDVGDLQEAERFLSLSDAAARESGLWRLRVAALLESADCRLARNEPECAWPLVEEAIALTGMRGHLVDDAGQFARLARHLTWVTRGYAAARRLEAVQTEEGVVRRPLDVLQVDAFSAWMAWREGISEHTKEALQKLFSAGLFGVLSRLIAVGARFPELPEPVSGESSAQLVARVFSQAERATVPRSVGLPEQGDEQ